MFQDSFLGQTNSSPLFSLYHSLRKDFPPPMIGAPAFAILTAHSPGVFPSPSPWGPAKVVMMVMMMMVMEFSPLLRHLGGLQSATAITAWMYSSQFCKYNVDQKYKFCKYNIRSSPMHIVAATGLLYLKARSIAHSISRMLWKYCIVLLLSYIVERYESH